MIPFDEIDQRLEKLGRNRKWLVETTGRSDHAIRSALAPNATAKSRSALLQKALTDAIEREEMEQAVKPELTKSIALEPSIEEYRIWSEAFKMSPYSTIEEWAKASLNEASGALHIVRPPMAADPAADGGKRRRM